MRAAAPPRQAERIAALRKYEILDTPREADFDELAQLASDICRTPIAVVNLIDEERQWFKAEVGLGVRETPLDTSICAHVILESEFVVIPDTLDDPRLADNPLCSGDPHLRFYAGALLMSSEGLPLGTLCVLDNKPRTLDAHQTYALQVLSRQVMTQMELRRTLALERRARAAVEKTSEALREALDLQELLAREVDHRVKNSLQIIAGVLAMQATSSDNAAVTEELEVARGRVGAVAALHECLHSASAAGEVEIDTFISRLGEQLQMTAPPDVRVNARVEPIRLDSGQAAAVGLLVNELVTNALKHAFPGGGKGAVDIEVRNDGGSVVLRVRDNGVGVEHSEQDGRRGGLGMKLVNATVGQLGGTLTRRSAAGETLFDVSFPLAAPGGAAKSPGPGGAGQATSPGA